MLPYLAQGANSAIEDGAVLGLLLGAVESSSHLPKALKLYEQLRKSRGEAIVRETFKQVRQRICHSATDKHANRLASQEGIISYARWTGAREARQNLLITTRKERTEGTIPESMDVS
jgi:2-polyprenyl-6-methoxyphenol hydroxylase-like FAD-dependent oxidoreductase